MVRLPAGARDFSVLHSFSNVSGAYPAPCSIGTEISVSSGIKRPRHEGDHFHVDPKLGKSEAMPLLPHMPYDVYKGNLHDNCTYK